MQICPVLSEVVAGFLDSFTRKIYLGSLDLTKFRCSKVLSLKSMVHNLTAGPKTYRFVVLFRWKLYILKQI